MRLSRLDHLVLTVKDIPRSVAFYTRVLGMTETTFGEGRKALIFGEQKINLHEQGKEIEPKATSPTPGSADLCFITDTPASKVLEHLTKEGVAVIDGPVIRNAARGEIVSVYFRDPDGNLIEVSHYR